MEIFNIANGSKLVISNLLLLLSFRILWYAEQTVFLVQYCRNFLEIHVQSSTTDTCTHICALICDYVLANSIHVDLENLMIAVWFRSSYLIPQVPMNFL